MPDDVERLGKDEISGSILQVLQSMYTATKTVIIYPQDNPSVQRMVESAHDAITSLIPPDGSLDLSFIEGKLVVNGEALDDAFQKRGIIKSFYELFKARRISSITFWSGLKKDELRKFLVILGTKAPSIGEQKEELYGLLEEQEIKHVELDEQIFVAISKREKVVDARASVEREEDATLKALKDEVFARFLAGEVSQADIDPISMKELLSNPDRIVGLVNGVIKAKGWDTEVRTLPFRVEETRDVLERISELIEQVDDPLVRSKLNREIGKIVTQIEAPQITDMLLTSSAGAERGPSALPKVVIPLIEDRKLATVIESILGEYKELAKEEAEADWPTERMLTLRAILDEAKETAGDEIKEALGGMVREVGVEEGPERMANVSGAELARSLIKGAQISECERVKGPVLVGAARELFKQGKDDIGASVMQKLGERFRAQTGESRYTAANQIWRLFMELREMGKEAFASDLIDDVSKALEEGKGASRTFDDLARTMEETAGGVAGLLQDAGITDFSSGAPSDQMMERLMTTDTKRVVEAVFASGDEAAKEAITKVLLQMEDRAIPALIDTAISAKSDEDIASVAKSLQELETDPMPQVASRLSRELEPEQTINLVKLISQVGDENSVSILNPLITVENPEIEIQVIVALGNLGGKQALQMVLAESTSIDTTVKTTAIRELGKFRDYLSVRRLMDVISPKKKGELPEDEQVMIAALKSLGDLNVIQVVPVISEIATGSRKKEAMSEEVRATAVRVLGMIKSKEAKNTLRHLLKDSSLLIRSTARRALEGE
ncbi:MAG: HEAT repeat domain-containing protein [Actinomycetota bacterium]|nr:HEAT repeat domain-containing protein [Actinomycetota bacterium]